MGPGVSRAITRYAARAKKLRQVEPRTGRDGKKRRLRRLSGVHRAATSRYELHRCHVKQCNAQQSVAG
jgi:hypothetical protein